MEVLRSSARFAHMRFVVAGGGVAGLAAALAVARAGHSAVVLERDAVVPEGSPRDAFAAERRGIPHFFQPHSFLPRGRRVLQEWAPDVLELLLEAGAEQQDLAAKLHGSREPGDEELVYLWVRRPVIEWALRRAAAGTEGVELRSGAEVGGLLTSPDGRRAHGVRLTDGEEVRGDVVVDALGRYRAPAGWPRAAAESHDSGAIYYSRYFALADGVDFPDWPFLNPRGDIGYMGFNTFRGDNRTYAVIVIVPAADRALRALKDETAWLRACATIHPLDVLTSPEHGRPLTGVMPMGGLMNVERTEETGVAGLIPAGDALCHTDPAFAWGLSFALLHAHALAEAAASDAPDAEAIGARYHALVTAEAHERFELACMTDDARAGRWAGEPLDVGRRDGCYPLFSFATAIAAAPHDDLVLRRTARRIGLLDRTDVFDADRELHGRIEGIAAELAATPRPPAGPPRDELLARLAAC
jgi:2-polyprenyl-6-methoxyphenol hydroxylase-like FAD-dependent oxidoreductase